MDSEDLESREARVALWREGSDLGFAWLKFGDNRQKRLYKERTGTSASLAYRQLMGADLFGRLGSRELVAMGYRTEPTVSDGPVVIPADVFDAPIGDDWGEAVIVASGWRYERVTVLALNDFKLVTKDSKLESVPSVEHPEQPCGTAGKKIGRKNTYGLCADVFDHWATTEPGLLKLSAEQLEHRFRQDYAAIHGVIAKLIPAPKARTLREKLKEYRSANIGRIRQE